MKRLLFGMAVLMMPVLALGADENPKAKGAVVDGNGPHAFTMIGVSNDAGQSIIIGRYNPTTKRFVVDASGSVAITGPVSVSGGTVTANQGTPNTEANGWPIKVTDGVEVAIVAPNGALAVGDTSGQQLGLESTLTTASSHLSVLNDRSGLLGNGLQVQGTRPAGSDFLENPVVIGGRDDTSPNNAIRALHTSSVGDVYIRPAIGLTPKVAYAEIDAAGETQLVAAQAGVKYRVTQAIVVNEGYTLAAGTIHFTATQTAVGGGPSANSNVIVPFAASNNAGVASPTQIAGAVSAANQPIYVNMESLTGGGNKVRIVVHYLEE